MTTALRLQVEQAALAAGLDVVLVGAIVEVESDGNPWAFRPEHRYRYLWDVRKHAPFRAVTPDELSSKVPPADFHSLTATGAGHEWWGQQMSWGPMQVMGAVAREQGFAGLFLSELSDPTVGIPIGCRLLRQLLRWADGNVSKAAGAYNAGRGGWDSSDGRAYATKVQTAMRALRAKGWT